MKMGNKAKKLLSNNKKLVVGVTIGALIMLPTTLYVNTKHNNQVYQENKSVETKPINNSVQAQDPVTEQQVPAQTNSQPNNNSSKTTAANSTPAPKSTQQPTATSTPQYVAEKPACSSSLRASAISTLKQSYQYQANKKDTDLQVWYRNNYQLSSYTYEQYQAKQAEYQAWLDNYIAIEIANKNASLSQYGVCTPITRSELGV
jgi:hypothetical protein